MGCSHHDVNAVSMCCRAESAESDDNIFRSRVMIKDILGRPQLQLPDIAEPDFIAGKTVLMSGGAGSVGAELAKKVFRSGARKIIILDHDQDGLGRAKSALDQETPTAIFECVLADVRDHGLLSEVFSNTRPHIIFHLAATKHVAVAEQFPIEAYSTNLRGTKNIAALAEAFGGERFVHFSTDKAASPTTIMGHSKLCAEFDLASRLSSARRGGGMKISAVRYCNVFGSSGSVIPKFREQISRRAPLSLTDTRVARRFMSMDEAVDLAFYAASPSVSHGADTLSLYSLDVGLPIPILSLLHRLVEMSGLRMGKDIDLNITGLPAYEKVVEDEFSEDEWCHIRRDGPLLISRPDCLAALNFDGAQLDAIIESRDHGALLDVCGRIAI